MLHNNPKTDEQPSTISTILSTIQAIPTYIASKLPDLTAAPVPTPAIEAPPPAKKKKRREKTEFSDNYTPAIKLPPTQTDPCCKTSASTSTQVIYDKLLTLKSYISASPVAPVTAPTAIVKMKSPSIRTQLEKLESNKKILADEIEKKTNELKTAKIIPEPVAKKKPAAGKKVKKSTKKIEDAETLTDSTTSVVTAIESALSLEIEALKTKMGALTFQQINLVEAEIVEHAARRVDLFFLLLVAVYNKKIRVNKGSTDKQHGTGSTSAGTQACHSSMFPNVTFALIDPAPATYFFAAPVCPTLKNTHLEELLNMTVELPKIVNDFDGWIEVRSAADDLKKSARSSEDILNYVAKGIFDPQVGLNSYLEIMNKFFSEMEKKIATLDPSRKEPMKRILELQKRGTFDCSNDNKTVSYTYFYNHLRMSRAEIALVNTVTSFHRYFVRAQEEIYNSRNIDGDVENRRIAAEEAKKKAAEEAAKKLTSTSHASTASLLVKSGKK